MTGSVCLVAVTVNLQGKTVELRQLGEDALFGRASYGKYAYAVGCERLFTLFERRRIKATVFVPGAEAEANPDYVAALAGRGHEIAAHGWAMEEMDAPGIDERALIERAHATLAHITGAAHPDSVRRTDGSPSGCSGISRRWAIATIRASRMMTGPIGWTPTAVPA